MGCVWGSEERRNGTSQMLSWPLFKTQQDRILRGEKELWKQFVGQEYPDFFKFIKLAEDGGFSEVKDLYYNTRWISSVVLIAFVTYNVYSVIALDVSFIMNPEEAVVAMGGEPARILDSYYSAAGIINWFVEKWHPDSEGVSAVPVLGALELLGLGVYLYWTIKYCFDAILDWKLAGFRRWYGIQYIFWDILPTLSTYSAIKLLNHVVPAVAARRATELVADFTEAQKSKFRVLFDAIQWLVVMVFAFIVGFDTFLLKLRVVAAKAEDPSGSFNLHVVAPCIQFLVQILGIVQLGPFVRKRLFQFVFGGEDGIMQEEEVELMETWNALLAKRIYRDLGWKKFLAVMTSFSDEDFQSLVLNEDDNAKTEIQRITSSSTKKSP